MVIRYANLGGDPVYTEIAVGIIRINDGEGLADIGGIGILTHAGVHPGAAGSGILHQQAAQLAGESHLPAQRTAAAQFRHRSNPFQKILPFA